MKIFICDNMYDDLIDENPNFLSKPIKNKQIRKLNYYFLKMVSPKVRGYSLISRLAHIKQLNFFKILKDLKR